MKCPAGTPPGCNTLPPQRLRLRLLLSLQDSRYDAIHVLIVGEESELRIHEVNDKVYRGRVALGERDAHGIAAGSAGARGAVAGDGDGTAGDQVEDRHATLELEDVRSAFQAKTGDVNLAEQIFLILNVKRSAVLQAQPAPVECVGPCNVAACEGAASLGSDSAVCDVDSAPAVRSLFLDDALGRGTQVENVFARSVEEVWIRERKSPAAGICRVEGDARVGPTVCFDEIAAVVGVFENACYRGSVSGESAHPGYATVDGTTGNDEDEAGGDAAYVGGSGVTLRHGVTGEHPAICADKPHPSGIHDVEDVILPGDEGDPASKTTQSRSLKGILCNGPYKGRTAEVTVVVVIEESRAHCPVVRRELTDKGLRIAASVLPGKIKNVGAGNTRNLERTRALLYEISASRGGLAGV